MPAENEMEFMPYHYWMQDAVGKIKGTIDGGFGISWYDSLSIITTLAKASCEINMEAIELNRKKIALLKLGGKGKTKEFDEYIEIYKKDLSKIIKNIDYFNNQLSEVIEYLPEEACHPALRVVYNNHQKALEKFSETQRRLYLSE